MAYRTLAWVMALICWLAIPAGAGTLAGSFFDEPIIQPGAYEKLVSLRARARGVGIGNSETKAGIQNSVLATTTPLDKAGSFNVVDNALLVSVNGNEVSDHRMSNGITYNKTTAASIKDCFNHFTGVANVNSVSGNLNVQKTYFSGPDLSGLLANSGSANLTAIRK